MKNSKGILVRPIKAWSSALHYLATHYSLHVSASVQLVVAANKERDTTIYSGHYYCCHYCCYHYWCGCQQRGTTIFHGHYCCCHYCWYYVCGFHCRCLTLLCYYFLICIWGVLLRCFHKYLSQVWQQLTDGFPGPDIGATSSG